MPAAPLPDNENERLAALAALNILDRNNALDFGVFPALATRALGAPVGAISLVDTDRQWFMASIGLEVTETPRSVSFCAHAILTPGEVLYVADATADPRFADNPLVLRDGGLRSYAGAPILSPSGQAIGALCVLDTQIRAYSPGALQILLGLARNVGNALRLHGALEDLRRQEAERSHLQSMLAKKFQDASEPVLVLRASGAILFGNGAYQALSGFNARELRTLSLQDLLAPEHQGPAGAAQARQFATGEPYTIESVMVRKDGARVPVRITSAAVQRSETQLFRIITMRPSGTDYAMQPGCRGAWRNEKQSSFSEEKEAKRL